MGNLRFVHWFSYFGPELPSVRYRAVHPLRELASRGVRHRIVFPGYSPVKMARFIHAWTIALFAPGKGSVIVVQRLYTRGLYATALKVLVFFRSTRTVYDIDDAEYMERHPSTIQFFMHHCALVTVGSEALRRYASRYNPNVHLLTSPIPRHRAKKEDRARVLTIGWIGCCWGTHRGNLDALFFPALQQLSIPLRVVVLGIRDPRDELSIRDRFIDHPNIQFEFPHITDWNDEEHVHSLLAHVDIGVAPLRDSEINRCKSAFKVKQFLSCGVPVLASPIGENSRFVDHGRNGFLCADVVAFREGIARFAAMEDPEYNHMSASARRSTASFDLVNYCNEFMEVTGALLLRNGALTDQNVEVGQPAEQIPAIAEMQV